MYKDLDEKMGIYKYMKTWGYGAAKRDYSSTLAWQWDYLFTILDQWHVFISCFEMVLHC